MNITGSAGRIKICVINARMKKYKSINNKKEKEA